MNPALCPTPARCTRRRSLELRRPPHAVVRACREPCRGTRHHQGVGSVRMGRSDHRPERPALRCSEDRSPLRTNGIHHRSNVVHPFVDRRRALHRIRQASTPLVQDDHSGKSGQPIVKASTGRPRADVLDLRDPTAQEHEIVRSSTEDPVCDVDVAALRVLSCRHRRHQPDSLSPSTIRRSKARTERQAPATRPHDAPHANGTSSGLWVSPRTGGPSVTAPQTVPFLLRQHGAARTRASAGLAALQPPVMVPRRTYRTWSAAVHHCGRAGPSELIWNLVWSRDSKSR